MTTAKGRNGGEFLSMSPNMKLFLTVEVLETKDEKPRARYMTVVMHPPAKVKFTDPVTGFTVKSATIMTCFGMN